MSSGGLFNTVCPVNPGAKPTFPLIIHGIVETLWILSLTVKPNPYRPLFFLLPIAILVLCSMTCTRIRLTSVGYELGLASRMIVVLLSASADILLSDPQKEIFAQEEKDAETKIEDNKRTSITANGRSPRNISTESFIVRLKWAAALHLNPRGIGYKHEPTQILPAKPSSFMSRKAFIIQRLLAIAVFYFIIDIARLAVHLYDARRKWLIQQNVTLGMFDTWRLLNVAFGLQLFAMLSYIHAWMAIFAVGLGFSKPRDWPFFFNIGYIPKTYTLRRFWGKFWHQGFRRIFQMHADFIAHDILRLPKSESKAILSVKIAIAFGFSGLLHYGGDAFALQSLSKRGSIVFFALQPLGLLLEDLAVGFWLSLGTVDKKDPTRRTSPLIFKIAGIVWLFLWFGYTLHIWTDAWLDGGYIEDMSKETFSPLMGLWKGRWIWPENNGWVWDQSGLARTTS